MGRLYDAEIGVYDVRARWYEPDRGCFLSDDPLGAVDSWNLYQYGWGTPGSWMDPFGLQSGGSGGSGFPSPKELMEMTQDELNEARDHASSMVSEAHKRRRYLRAHLRSSLKFAECDAGYSRIINDGVATLSYIKTIAWMRSIGLFQVGLMRGPGTAMDISIAAGYDPTAPGRTPETGERVLAAIGALLPVAIGKMFGVGDDIAKASGRPAVDAVVDGSKYTTPGGIPFSDHYLHHTGPKRNIPGSVIDETVNSSKPFDAGDGKAGFYDPGNNVTVILGNEGVVSAHKGKPRSNQMNQ